MPRINGTTDAESKFLRAFKGSPFGPGAQDWPSAAILRRWLRKPGFVAAMRSVKRALRYQADFQLLSSASAAAQHLHTCVTSDDPESNKRHLQAMSNLMKLAHLRERFTKPEPPPPPRESLVIGMLRHAHPAATVQSVRDYLKTQFGIDLKIGSRKQRKGLKVTALS